MKTKTKFGPDYEPYKYINLPTLVAADLRKFGLSGTDILVLYEMLAWTTKDSYEMWAAQRTLAERVGITSSGVRKAILKLIDAGLVFVTKYPTIGRPCDIDPKEDTCTHYSLSNLPEKLSAMRKKIQDEKLLEKLNKRDLT